MSTPVETAATVPVQPAVELSPEQRREQAERLRFAADVAATFCCEAYGDPNVTRLGGA